MKKISGWSKREKVVGSWRGRMIRGRFKIIVGYKILIVEEWSLYKMTEY